MEIFKKVKKEIIKTHLFNLITSRLHQRKRRKELRQLVGNITEKYQRIPMEQQSKEVSDYIWVCWWQGEQDMSPIVKECYRRIRIYNQDKQVVLITNENLREYVSFPDYILEKYQKGLISKTHFSDLLRTELLLKYGGVWMDITLLTYSGIPSNFYDYPVYTGRFQYNRTDYNVSKNRWTSFFLVSRYPNNILFQYLSDFWRSYWKEKDCLIEYFLIDYAIDFGYRNIPAVKKELDLVPLNGCGENVWKLLKLLPCPYDCTILKAIKDKNWMQKLSYKGEEHIQEKASEPENSIYKRLFLDGDFKF